MDKTYHLTFPPRGGSPVDATENDINGYARFVLANLDKSDFPANTAGAVVGLQAIVADLKAEKAQIVERNAALATTINTQQDEIASLKRKLATVEKVGLQAGDTVRVAEAGPFCVIGASAINRNWFVDKGAAEEHARALLKKSSDPKLVVVEAVTVVETVAETQFREPRRGIDALAKMGV